MRKILVVFLLAAAVMVAQVQAREDDDKDVDHHNESKEKDSEENEEHRSHTEERLPEPRANAILQNTQSTGSSAITTQPATHATHSHHSHHSHHHHHHHNETTTAQPRQKAVTCLPRSITGRIRDLLVDEQTVVVLYEFKKNATIPSDITFENYLVECLKHTKLEVRINNYPFKNFTVVPGAILTTNQVAAVDDLPYLSTFDVKLGISQNRLGEEEYFTDERQTKTCYSGPSPVVNLRRSTLSNGSLWIEWDAPAETNAPSICYYQIVVKDLNANKEKSHNQNERTFIIPKEELKSQYRITVYAMNSHSCYINQYPFVEECRKKDLGSVGQIIDYRPPSLSTTKKPSGASQIKYSSILFAIPLLVSKFLKY